MPHYRGNSRIGKLPNAAATWGARDEGRYWRALDRINRNGAASKAVLDARRFANLAAWPDDASDDVCEDRCVRCGAADQRIIKDHITPLYKGGSDGIDNLQPLCWKCNRSKTEELVDNRPENWRQEVDKIIDISYDCSSESSSECSSESSSESSSDGSSDGSSDRSSDRSSDGSYDLHSHNQNHSQNHENQKTRHQNQKPLTEKSNTADEGNISTTTTPPEPLDFELFRSICPKRLGSQEWRRAAQAANARIREGYTFEDMIEGAKRYALFCEATDKTGSLYVKQAATFLGPDLPFTEPWTLPESTAERWERRNRETARSAVDLLKGDDE